MKFFGNTACFDGVIHLQFLEDFLTVATHSVYADGMTQYRLPEASFIRNRLTK